MCKSQGKSYAKGKYVVIGVRAGGKKIRVIWLDTNEQVGIFDTRQEAEEQAKLWNEIKKDTGKRPI